MAKRPDLNELDVPEWAELGCDCVMCDVWCVVRVLRAAFRAPPMTATGNESATDHHNQRTKHRH
jgi:hypothetical protein